MGLCIDSDETEHGIGFEVRTESVVFYPSDGESVEILKTDLLKIEGLMNDIVWRHRLLPNTEVQGRLPQKENNE